WSARCQSDRAPAATAVAGVAGAGRCTACQTIIAVNRRAKYLLLATTGGQVCLHLGMSGRLRIVSAHTTAAKHDHVDIVLENGQVIRFNDSRRFGSIFWLTGDINQFSLLADLGPEPL